MARIFQTVKTKTDPGTGERVPCTDRNGNPVYHDSWRFTYTSFDGKRVTKTGYASKRETEKLAASLEREAMEVRTGIRPVPHASAKAAKRPVSEIAELYLQWGERQGGRGGRPWSTGHAAPQRHRLGWWVNTLGLESMSDLDGILSRAECAVSELDLAGKTLKDYCAVLKSFCAWAVKRGFLMRNPVQDLGDFDATPQEVRRELLPDEIRRILRVAEPDRKIFYEVAACTGLRVLEIRQLSVDQFDAKASALHLTAEQAKGRKAAVVYLPAVVADRLRDFVAAGDALRLYEDRRGTKNRPGVPLLYVPKNYARSFYQDMERAGIARHAPGGVVNFHCFRVAFVNMAIASGADAKTVQEAARHQSLVVTMGVYAKARESRMRDLAERIGEAVFSEPESETSAQRKAAGAETLYADSSYMERAMGFEPTALSLGS